MGMTDNGTKKMKKYAWGAIGAKVDIGPHFGATLLSQGLAGQAL
jgi:hypothetical protein